MLYEYVTRYMNFKEQIIQFISIISVCNNFENKLVSYNSDRILKFNDFVYFFKRISKFILQSQKM